MRLIYVTPFLSIPPDYGLSIRNYHILQYLSQHHTVEVVLCDGDEPGRTGEWLLERGCRLAQLPPLAVPRSSQSRRDSLRRALTYPPLYFQRFSPARLARHLQTSLSQRPDTDAIVFDTQLTGQVLVEHSLPKPCACVMVIADVYEVFMRRRLSAVGLRPFALISLADWLQTRAYERAILKSHQHIVTVSPGDREVVARLHPEGDIAVSPNGVDTRCFTPSSTPRTPNHLLFVGSFSYEPNADAFLYFCERVLPIIRQQRPDVRVTAVGREPTPRILALGQADPMITVTGSVADVRPYYASASVAIVPLRYGSGTKLKTLEAFAMGVPVVATSVGCEGLSATDGEHALIADTPRVFAERTLQVLQYPAQAEEMAWRARRLVERYYSWDAIAPRFEEYLRHVVSSSRR
jgi:glycosyltransferase involved in cell wall biosynthesis